MIANTKGFTGHAMGTGIEDVVAVKALETGCVPPVANFKEVDPELGTLNLSKGGAIPSSMRCGLGAGFGSQISMTLLRWSKTPDGVRVGPKALGYASRVADPKQWNAWLCSIAGFPTAELEVVKRTLRVRDQGPRVRVATTPAGSRRCTHEGTSGTGRCAAYRRRGNSASSGYSCGENAGAEGDTRQGSCTNTSCTRHDRRRPG